MKVSRIIGVGVFIGVLFVLGVVGGGKIALAQTTWGTNASEHRGKNGQQFTYVCPPNGSFGSLWGSDIYTDDSSICTAAVHAGLITREAGGTVTIEIRPGEASYRSESRLSISGSGETITSSSYGAWSGSFVFVRGGTITQPPPTSSVINVVAGTYGPNCNAAYGNVTNHLAASCNGRPQCDYVIDYNIIGDAVPGCSKNYIAEWRCGGNPTVYRVEAPNEAGYGSRITLSCTGAITPPQQTNRPPNAPTLLSPANTYQPPVGINPQNPYVQLSWQNNGDPDNDPLNFALDIMYWDPSAQVWQPIFKEYVQGTSFTLTPPRLAYNTYYAWGVVAVEGGQRSNPLSTPTNWSYFLTSASSQGGDDIIIEIQP